ncbi:UNVERIFIED_CONTAM: hypothetical protein RMT77_019281 [Armadillidium vulgare]
MLSFYFKSLCMFLFFLCNIIHLTCHSISSSNSSYSIIISPGLVMNFAHTAYFISGYLDLRVDLRCTKDIFDKITYSYADVNSIKSSFIPFVRTKLHSFETSPTNSFSSKNLPILNPSYITPLYHSSLLNSLAVDNKMSSDDHWTYNSNFYVYHMDILEQQFAHLSNTLRDLLNDPWIKSAHHSKSRRGLIDVGGQFLKVLFGTAIDSDVKTLQHQIEVLSEHSNNIDSLFIKFRNQLRDNTDSLDKLSRSVSELQNSTQHLQLAFSFLNCITLLNSYFVSVNNYVVNINNIKSILLDAYQLSHRKTTSYNLYTFDSLLPYISENSKVTKSSPLLPFTVENFYNFLSASWTIPDYSSYHIITIIPFMKNDVYNVYHLIPFPTPSSINSTSSLSSRIILRPSYNVFFVSKSLMKYTYLSTIQFSYCLHVHNLTVCPMLQAINSFSSPSCELFLYTNNSYLDYNNPTPIHCNHEPYLSNEPVTASAQSTLLISLTRSLDGQLSCHKGNIVKDIQISSIYALRLGCTLTTSQYKFENPSHISRNISFSLNTPDIPVIYSYLNHSFEHVKILKLTNLPIVHWNTQLDSLNKTLQYSHFLNPRFFPYANSASIIIGILILIIVILIFHFKIKRLSSIQNHSNLTTNIPQPSLNPNIIPSSSNLHPTSTAIISSPILPIVPLTRTSLSTRPRILRFLPRNTPPSITYNSSSSELYDTPSNIPLSLVPVPEEY